MAFPTTLTPARKTDWANTTPMKDTHPDEHNGVAADVEALKTKVGIDSSADTNSLDYKLKNPSSVSPGHKHNLADIADYAAATDAAVAVKGVTRLSEAPAVAATPIAIGANGTSSGTAASSSNKVIDAADVSNAGASGKVVRLNGTSYPAGDGSALTGLTPTKILASYIAGETLAAGNAVYIKPYATNPVTFDAKGTFNTGSSSSFSSVFTVGANSNRILLVACACSSAQTITGVTYAGNAMTALLSNTGNDSAYTYSLYFILAPTTGANNITVTTSAATAILVNASSYYNVEQVTPRNTINASGSNNAAVSTSLLPNNIRSFIFSMFSTSRTTGNQAGTAYSTNLNSQTGLKSGDSGEVVPLGSKTATFTADNSGFVSNVWLYAIDPVSSGATSRVYKTSASQAGSVSTYNGIAQESATVGNSVSVLVAGEDTNQSGLSEGKPAFASNTAGAVSSTPGTVSKCLGLATSSTKLLVQKVDMHVAGVATKDLSEASTTQRINHGLGVIPKNITLLSATPNTSNSAQYRNGSYMCRYDSGGAYITTTAFVIDAGGASAFQSGVVTVDSEYIIITWTKTGSPTGTTSIFWEVSI